MNDEHGEGLSRQARALIAIGREGDQPSTADRTRVRAKLLAGIAGTATAIAAAKTSAAAQLSSGAAGTGATGATVSAAGTGVTSGLLSTKLGAGMVVALLATAGASAVVMHVAQRAPTAERQHGALVDHAGGGRASGGHEDPAASDQLGSTRPSAIAGLGPTGHAAPADDAVAAAPASAQAIEPSAAADALPSVAAAADEGEAASAPLEDSPHAAIEAAQLHPAREPALKSVRAAHSRSSRRSANPSAAHKPAATASNAAEQSAVAVAPSTATPAATAAASEQTDVAPSLRRELTLIAAAQAALARNAPDEALRWLDAHAAGYASGELVQERWAARAVALCALGRNAEGRRAVSELARLAPHSPLLGRARRACASDLP